MLQRTRSITASLVGLFLLTSIPPGFAEPCEEQRQIRVEIENGKGRAIRRSTGQRIAEVDYVQDFQTRGRIVAFRQSDQDAYAFNETGKALANVSYVSDYRVGPRMVLFRQSDQDATVHGADGQAIASVSYVSDYGLSSNLVALRQSDKDCYIHSATGVALGNISYVEQYQVTRHIAVAIQSDQDAYVMSDRAGQIATWSYVKNFAVTDHHAILHQSDGDFLVVDYLGKKITELSYVQSFTIEDEMLTIERQGQRIMIDLYVDGGEAAEAERLAGADLARFQHPIATVFDGAEAMAGNRPAVDDTFIRANFGARHLDEGFRKKVRDLYREELRSFRAFQAAPAAPGLDVPAAPASEDFVQQRVDEILGVDGAK